jgi:hypothetical protein
VIHQGERIMIRRFCDSALLVADLWLIKLSAIGFRC